MKSTVDSPMAADRRVERRLPRRKASLLAGLGVFTLVLLCRHEVLTSPPYWDPAIGLWTEAAVIRRSGFDLWNHWLHGQTTLSGGETTYRFSLLPPFVGLLMAAPTPTGSFVMYHLLTFACASVVAVLLYRLLAPAAGRWVAMLTVAALLTSPIFSTQIDMLGMEIPLALVTLLTASFVSGHRYAAAIAVALGGMLVKATSVVLLLALFCQLVLLGLFAYRGAEPPLKQRIRTGFFTCLPALVLAWLMMASDADRLAHPKPAVFVLALVWFPDLSVMTSVGLGFFLIWYLRPTWGRREDASRFSWRGAIGERTRAEPLLLFSAIAVAGTFVSFVFAHPLPRYVTFVMPLMFLLLLAFLGLRYRVRFVRDRNSYEPRDSVPHPALPVVSSAILGALIVYQLGNWNGDLYPSADRIAWITYHQPSDALRRDGSILERSHAYLADHNANIALFRRFSKLWDGAPVFVGFPFCSFVTLPELGYVETAMNGYLTNGYHLTRGGLEDAARAVEDSPPVAWFVYSRNPLYQHLCRFYVPPPSDAEATVCRDELDPPVIIYRKVLTDADLAHGLRNWYLRHLGPHPEALKHYPIEFHNRDWAVVQALDRIGRVDLRNAYIQWRERERSRDGATIP